MKGFKFFSVYFLGTIVPWEYSIMSMYHFLGRPFAQYLLVPEPLPKTNFISFCRTVAPICKTLAHFPRSRYGTDASGCVVLPQIIVWWTAVLDVIRKDVLHVYRKTYLWQYLRHNRYSHYLEYKIKKDGSKSNLSPACLVNVLNSLPYISYFVPRRHLTCAVPVTCTQDMAYFIRNAQHGDQPL